jgi:26S proteasome regulatory subunit N3
MELAAQPTTLELTEDAEVKLHCTYQRTEEISKLPEAQMFIYVLVLMKLIDDGDLKSAKEFGDFIIQRMKGVNRRTLDHLAAKAYYFISVAYEKMNLLPSLRPQMFEGYKSCCLHLD